MGERRKREGWQGRERKVGGGVFQKRIVPEFLCLKVKNVGVKEKSDAIHKEKLRVGH